MVVVRLEDLEASIDDGDEFQFFWLRHLFIGHCVRVTTRIAIVRNVGDVGFRL